MTTTENQEAARRGRCSVCGFRFRLRRDGTVQTHRLWIGPHQMAPCAGSGAPARPDGAR